MREEWERERCGVYGLDLFLLTFLLFLFCIYYKANKCEEQVVLLMGQDRDGIV